MQKVFQKGRKHCKKEKLLVTSNFSFSDRVFKEVVLQTCGNKSLFGKELSMVCQCTSCWLNQSVENAAVTFVKGAYERNEFLEKINEQ